MAPPWPPWRVLMRRTASRAQRKLPIMLVSNMRLSRATAMSSTVVWHVHHAGVVHQGSQHAQFGVDSGEHGQHLGLVRHIGLHRDGGATQGADLADHLVGCRGVGGVVDGYGVAFACGQHGAGCADAAAAAGDEQDRCRDGSGGGGCHAGQYRPIGRDRRSGSSLNCSGLSTSTEQVSHEDTCRRCLASRPATDHRNRGPRRAEVRRGARRDQGDRRLPHRRVHA